MSNVSGAIFENDKQVSTYSGNRATSKRDSNVLTLEGNVKVFSPKDKATLYCDVLEWHGDQDLIVARGNVLLETQGYEFGKAPVVLSTADLSEVATPSVYARSNMEVRKKLAATIASAAALASGQQAAITLRGKDGTFAIRNTTQFNLRTDPSNRNAILFFATGSPVRGIMEAQRMTAEASQVEGRAERSSGGVYLLERATLTGDVHIAAARPSQAPGASNQQQTVTLDTPKAIYTQDLEKVTFEGKVTVVQSDPAAKQSFRISGSSGFLTLYPQASAPASRSFLKSLQLDGPVTFQIKSQRQVTEGAPPVRKMLPYTIDGSCRELSYDDTTRKLVLNQNVKIDADDPLYPITSTARKVTITFDPEGNPIEIQGEGEPGTTVATQRPPKGRARN